MCTYTSQEGKDEREIRRDFPTPFAAEPDNLIPLSELPVGTYAAIWQVTGGGTLRRRLLDMGLTPKTRVYLRKTAPLGDPIELTVRGYDLSLRKSDASFVLVIGEETV